MLAYRFQSPPHIYIPYLTQPPLSLWRCPLPFLWCDDTSPLRILRLSCLFSPLLTLSPHKVPTSVFFLPYACPWALQSLALVLSVSKSGFLSLALCHHFQGRLTPSKHPKGKVPTEHVKFPLLNSLFDLHACFGQWYCYKFIWKLKTIALEDKLVKLSLVPFFQCPCSQYAVELWNRAQLPDGPRVCSWLFLLLFMLTSSFSWTANQLTSNFPPNCPLEFPFKSTQLPLHFGYL